MLRPRVVVDLAARQAARQSGELKAQLQPPRIRNVSCFPTSFALPTLL